MLCRPSGVDNLRLGSPSTTIIPRNFPTQRLAISSPSLVPSTLSRMPPWIIPFMHSYRRDMAGVVRMIVINGGSSFLTNRGSNGVNVANLAELVELATGLYVQF